MRRPVVAWAMAGVLACMALPSSAEVHQFALETPSGVRNITVESVAIDGTPYVSLQALVNEAGGTFNALPARLRVDLFGSTAWLRVGESRVHALSIFSLEHPILEQDDAFYIAKEDLADFFLKSFRVRLREQQPSPPEVPPTEPLNDMPVSPPEAGAVVEPLQQVEPAAPGVPAPEPSARYILIDPGHGGFDAGVQGVAGVTEKSVALAVAERVRDLLSKSSAFSVALTREKDVELSEAQRAVAANNSQANVLITLHTGSALSPAVEGIAVLFPGANALAQQTAAARAGAPSIESPRTQASERMARTLATTLATATGARLRGVVEAPVRMLASTTMPSVMVELGCLSNPDEAARLATEEYQQSLAEGIANGLLAYAGGLPDESKATPQPAAGISKEDLP